MNEAEAVYRYSYAGREYTGHRVSLSLGADNFGDFQERVAQQMQEARNDAGGAFFCYVNPAQPYESVLFRQARWTLLLFTSVFPLMFPLVGAFVCLAGLQGMGARKKIHALQSRYPDEPWRWDPNQQGEWLLPENRPRPIRATVTLGWMVLVWGPMLFALSVESDMSRENPVSLLGLLPVLPLGMMTVHTLRSWVRQGRPVPQVHVQPLPVLTGGPLQVQVALPAESTLPQTPRAALAEPEVNLQLSCCRQWVDRSGNENVTREEQVWTDTQSVPLSLAVREVQGSRLEVAFDLPARLPARSLPRLGDTEDSSGLDWFWKLDLSAPGWPQSWRYDLPVYEGGSGNGTSSGNGNAATVAGAAAVQPPAAPRQENDMKRTAEAAHRMLALDADELEMHLRKEGMSMVTDAQGLPHFFDLPLSRFTRGRLGICVTSAVVLLIILALVVTGQFIGIILLPGLFLLVTGAIVVTMLTHRQLRLLPDSLEVTRILGPWRRSRQVLRQEILRFESKQNIAVGAHSYQEVRAHLKSGKSVAVADGLYGRLVGEAMVTELEHWRVRA